jgi:hypothetical protein
LGHAQQRSGGRDEATRHHPTTRSNGMSFRTFRRRHPGFIAAAAIIVAGLLVLDAWLVYKGERYARESQRLRSGMTEFERRRSDALLASEERRMRVMLELIRRQAKIDPDIHLAVSVDSARMFLEREGALLRESDVEIGPEKRVGAPPRAHPAGRPHRQGRARPRGHRARGGNGDLLDAFGRAAQ